MITSWESKEVSIPAFDAPARPETAKLYFYDIPDSKQSILQFGYPALASTNPDYYPAVVMNYILGGGGFASRLTQELREGKGYTYGIRSSFSGGKVAGPFSISSGVRSNVTYESAQLVKDILTNYAATYTPEDLETTQSFMIKSNARAFETAGAKLAMLENISEYGWAPAM
ncbi:M16 family metallopeptidase [Algoriphagus chordae]|uniref:Zinc protease n=1 Tax=Algoriphagus chordae TaxID=237019 RepID=A0A2W7R2D1_9BACT|nr:insulinase family protein [Algoriphagus chordae]PZX54958.1 zinc protease [Algoriphagus chordae]